MNLLVGTPGSSRVEINNNGIEGYDSSNTKQFYIRTSDGRGAFGPASKPCILDSTGMMLYGNETAIQDWTSVRWLTDPPAGTEVARLTAGFYSANTATPMFIANPAQTYPNSDCALMAYGNSSTIYASFGTQVIGGNSSIVNGYCEYGSQNLAAAETLRVYAAGYATWTISASSGVNLTATIGGGLNVGSATGAGTGEIRASGPISISRTGGATANVNVGTFYASDLAAGYYSRIIIGKQDAVADGVSLGFMEASSDADTYSFWLVAGDGLGAGVNLRKGGKVGIGITSPSYQLQLSTDSAAKPSTNTWTIASDARLKRDIVPFTDGLAVLRQVNPIRYTYNGLAGMPESEGIGVIGQEIEKVAPYTAHHFKAKLKPDDAEETELVGFNSHALTFVLINAVKELDSRLSAIERGRNQ
jgi:hypothetical protein